MQIKNIILSAAAALAMVSAAPIDQTPDHAAAFNALSAAPSAPEAPSTPGAPEAPTTDVAAPDHTEGLDFDTCARFFNNDSPEGLDEAELKLRETCNECWISYHDQEEILDEKTFFKNKCHPETAPVDTAPIEARDEAVSGLPTEVKAPEGPKAPTVNVPGGAKAPEVSDVKTGETPTVNTAGKSA